MSYANKKGADQPAHPRSLISAFVVRCLDSRISLNFYIRSCKPLASFCGCAGRFLSYLVANPENRFSHDGAHISRIMTKPTNWYVRPAKTQISLGIRPVWSESSLSAGRKLGSLATHWAHSEDSDQPGHPTAKTLIRLSGCPGWSESSLGAQSFCWFCHEAAHMSCLTTARGAAGCVHPSSVKE